VVNIECPNFFPLGKKWVLITSPHRACDYFIGDFDPDSGRFTVEKKGMVDYSDQYYAPNGLRDQKGRRIIWGWIRGFREGRGWNGCLSLPRELQTGPDGRLRQNPIPELKRLRGKGAALHNLDLEGAAPLSVPGNQLEIEMEVELKNARVAGVRVCGIPIRVTTREVSVEGQTMPTRTNGRNKLRIFLDRSVLEVFLNEGSECVTRVVYPSESAASVELFSESGVTRFHRVQAWPLRPIW
jgi:beta-fructofuranosidase